MAQLGMYFDPNAVEPSQGFELLPPGEYRVQITNSDVRATKSGDGRLIWTEMEVMDGEHANRKLWHNFNIINPNERAQNIGQNQLSALCHAIGVGSVEDSEELHFKPFSVLVGVQPPKDGYEAQNRIKVFREAGRGSGIRSARPAPTRQGAPNGSGGGGRQVVGSRPGGGQVAPGRPWAQGRDKDGRSDEENRARQERTNRLNQPDQSGLDDDIPF